MHATTPTSPQAELADGARLAAVGTLREVVDVMAGYLQRHPTRRVLCLVEAYDGPGVAQLCRDMARALRERGVRLRRLLPFGGRTEDGGGFIFHRAATQPLVPTAHLLVLVLGKVPPPSLWARLRQWAGRASTPSADEGPRWAARCTRHLMPQGAALAVVPDVETVKRRLAPGPWQFMSLD